VGVTIAACRYSRNKIYFEEIEKNQVRNPRKRRLAEIEPGTRAKKLFFFATNTAIIVNFL